MADNTTMASNQRDRVDGDDILLYIVSTTDLVVNAAPLLMFSIQRCRRPSANRLSPAGVLVLNLLFTDALVGIMGIIVTSHVSFKLEPNAFTLTPYGCVSAVIERYFVRMGSHMALINVAIDRYLAVTRTLHYRDLMNMKRCWLLIGVGWLVPILGTAGAYLTNKGWTPGLEYCHQIPSFTIFLVYILLPYRIAALAVVFFIQCRIFLFLRNHERNEFPHHLRQYSRKSAQALVWVTTTYIICWLPYDVLQPLSLLHYRAEIFKLVRGATILAYCSYTVNAFIFSYKTENIRKPVSDLCRDVCQAVARDKKGAAPDTVNQIATVSKEIETKV